MGYMQSICSIRSKRVYTVRIGAPFTEGPDFVESLAKVLRLVFLIVEDFFVDRCPILAREWLSRVFPSRKSRLESGLSSVAAILNY